MDDVPLCPPWWPQIIWWLIHHPHGPGPDPDPHPDRELFAKLNEHYATVAISALAAQLSNNELRKAVTSAVGKAASDPMPGLTSLTQAGR